MRAAFRRRTCRSKFPPIRKRALPTTSSRCSIISAGRKRILSDSQWAASPRFISACVTLSALSLCIGGCGYGAEPDKRETFRAEADVIANMIRKEGMATFAQIGKRTNIQDGTIVHVDPGEFSTVIGDDVTIGHACIIHGCRLEDRAFVGMGAIVMKGAVIESGGVLGAGGLLTAGRTIAAGELWTGAPAKLRRVLTEREREEFTATAPHYVRNGARFRGALASFDPKLD